MAPDQLRSDFRFIRDLIFLATVWFLSYRDILIMHDFMFDGRRAASQFLGLPDISLVYVFSLVAASLPPRNLYVSRK